MSWLSSLSPRNARFLAIVILVVFVWATYTLIVKPLVIAQSDLNAEIASAHNQLNRLETVLARHDGSLSTATSNQPDAAWTGASPPIIAANVQSLVQTLAQENGITIVSISQTQSRYSENVQTAGLVIEGHGEIAAFVELFSTLERNRPLLFVDTLMLRRYLPPGNTPPGTRLPLAARFEIHAPHHLEVSG